MKRPAIFFDRDNTLIITDGYLFDPNWVKLVPGAAGAVARARELGFATVVVSNQSGVARGMFAEADVHAVNQRMDDLLRAENPDAIIDRHEFCPFHPEGVIEAYRKDSDLRKPKPGMILRAAETLALDLKRSWLIGDAPRDIEAGAEAGCRTILCQDPDLAPSEAAEARSSVVPDRAVCDLSEAMDYIAAHVSRDTPVEPTGPVVASVPTDLSSVTAGVLVDDAHSVTVDTSSNIEAPLNVETPVSVASVSSDPVASSAPEPTISPALHVMQPAGVEPARRVYTNRATDRPVPAAPVPAVAPVGAVAPLAAVAPVAAVAAVTPAPALQPVHIDLSRVEALGSQILQELRRRNDLPTTEFSVSKLLAGIVQVIVLAVLILSYLNRNQPGTLVPTLLVAMILQTLTATLLIMGKQR